MSWRIRQIGVYSKNGDLRAVKLEPHGLNIVTGDSQTGKSALQEIVAYCLATGSCPVPKGRIRNACEAVGINIASGTESLNVIRLLPPSGQETTSKFFIDYAPALPEKLPAKTNVNLDETVKALNGITGISPVRTLQVYGDPGAEPDSLNIKHCRSYLFQPQDVIASRHVTFPGLDDYKFAQHVRDSIPYFFGFLSAEDFGKLGERRVLERQRKALEQEKRELDRLGSRPLARANQLLDRARGLGLQVAPEMALKTEQDVFGELRRLSVEGAKRASLPDPGELRKRYSEAQRKVRQLQPRVIAYDEFLDDNTAHHRVTEEQRHRLDMAMLLPDAQSGVCPICNQPGSHAAAALKQVQKASQALESIERNARPFEHSIAQRGSKLREQLAEYEVEAGRLARDLENAKRQRGGDPDEERRLSELVGAIQQYLATASPEVSPVETRLLEVNQKLQAYDEIREKERFGRQQAEDRISRRMTALAPELRVEYPQAPCRLNLDTLTIQVHLDGKWTSLGELGSGANWVNYHVLAAAAAHEHFAHNALPVPHVVMLDQPSQAWFPPDPGNPEQMPKDERERDDVLRIYRLLHEIASQPEGPQVIAVDHARIGEKWFEDSIVEEWRETKFAKPSPHRALVPKDWP